MIDYDVKVSPSQAGLKREDQLAWKIAGVAADKVAATSDVASVIGVPSTTCISPHIAHLGPARVAGIGMVPAPRQDGYRTTDPHELSFGGRVEIFPRDGTKPDDEIAVANAHPLGAEPFGRAGYIHAFYILTDGINSTREPNRLLEAVQDLARLPAGELHRLNIALPAGKPEVGKPGILQERGTLNHE